NIQYMEASQGAPLGDVLLAGVGNKIFNYKEVKKWSKVSTMSTPDQKNQKIYAEFFKIYHDLYANNKALYPRLQK
ncbi:MAG: hypothetical protein ACTSSI_16195, partial [Candidatus Helarchaeota archaeon]